MKMHCFIQKTIGLIISVMLFALSTVSFTYAYERHCYSYHNGYYCHYYNNHYYYHHHYYYYHHHYYHDNNNFAAGVILGGILGAIASSNQMQPSMPYSQRQNCHRVMVTHIYNYHDQQRFVKERSIVCN